MTHRPLLWVLLAVTILSACRNTLSDASDAGRPVSGTPSTPARAANDGAGGAMQARALAAQPTPSPAQAQVPPTQVPGQPAVLDEKQLETFVGFSPDETKLAYTVYGEGAGSYILKVFDVEKNALLQQVALSTVGEMQQARRIIEEGKYASLPQAKAGWSARWQAGRIEVLRDGKVIGQAKLLGSPLSPKEKLTVETWATSPSGKYVLVEAIVDSGAEFGKSRTFALMEAKSAAK